MEKELLMKEIEKAFEEVKDLKELDELRIKYIGKKGILTNLSGQMKDLPNEEKRAFGQSLNELKTMFQKLFDDVKESLELDLLNQTLQKEKIDITLPSTRRNLGSPHILEKLTEEVEELFMSMGYDVEEGPEVEKDLYNFEMLNLPKGHPARDAQDTFYVKDDEMLLRSHTSPVQVRTMLKNEDKGPIRIICPGKTYRRDYDDATHSHQFCQCEGLLLDHNISLADLKGTFDVFAKKMFGEERLTRFRPSFYPFTEPSVEMDISCFNCGMKGCPICKGTGWITIGGAGMVHPNVLKMSGYDPETISGFAFGFGLERVAMLKYGIPDIRMFYLNDLRINKQFARRDGE